jgi:hypothetical protein
MRLIAPSCRGRAKSRGPARRVHLSGTYPRRVARPGRRALAHQATVGTRRERRDSALDLAGIAYSRVMRGFLKQFAPDVFRPEEISILEDALDDAWRRIEISKAAWASADYSTVGRTILAKYIITMAKGGERDAKWLADSAVLYLSQKKLAGQAPEAP